MAKKDKEAGHNFMSEEELAQVRRATRKLKGSHTLPPNASALARNKYELCRQFIVYMRDHGISQRELARRLSVSESRVSEIVHYNLGKITLDRLVELHEMLDNKITLNVA